MRGDNIEEPDIYLGPELSNMTNVDGQQCRAMSSDKYCAAAGTNVESVQEKRGLRLPLKCATPLSCGYRPEMDVTGDIKAD